MIAPGYYWVWYDGEWIQGNWDGEDWDLSNGVTTSRGLPIGPKWKVPPKPSKPPTHTK